MGQIVPDKRFNIPMALTWARIAFIPLIVGVFYVPDVILSPHVKNLLACVMFVVAAITDALDGYIARRYNMMTNMGHSSTAWPTSWWCARPSLCCLRLTA